MAMAVVLLLAMAGIVGAPIRVEALSDGSISGTVTGAQGEPLQGVFITVFDELDVGVGQAATDATGHFSISQLPTNQLLRLSAVPDFFSPYQTTSITGVVLGPAESRVIDVQFSLGASISGHVTTADGTPVTGRVALYEINTGAQNGAGVFGGNFAVSNLTPGTWVAYASSGQGFGDPYAPEYFGGGYTVADATPIVVAEGAQVTGIDITLDLGASVSGQVLDDHGRPALNADVQIPAFNGPPGSSVLQRFATVGADSRYTFVGLPPGSFELVATADPVTGLGAARVPVAVGLGDAITGVDIAMERGVFGTAQVLDANGPLPVGSFSGFPVVCDPAASFDPFELCGAFPTANHTPNPAGTGWIIGPLSPGDYTARGLVGNSFGQPAALHAIAGSGFSCTLPGDGFGPAECVASAAPAAGSVSGRVVGDDGLGIEGVEVRASVMRGFNASSLPTRAFTDANGDYTLPDVFVGAVRIQFLTPATRPDLQSAWWSAASVVSSAQAAADVTVVDGAATTGIDATLSSGAFGHITLTRNGAPLTVGSGLTATFCPAPAVYVPTTFNCSGGIPALTVGINSLPLPLAQVPPGIYNLQSFEFSFLGPVSGAPIRLQLAGRDEFDCTLPVEPAGTPTCTVNGVPLDSTPPVIDGQLTPSVPDGDNFWWRSDVTAHWNVSEPESPASLVTDGCQDLSVTGDTTGTQTLCSATSDGGSSGPVQLFVRRDATPPSVLWVDGPADGQTYPVGQVPSPLCFAQDATSGANGCVVTGWSDQPGTHSLSATARDMAGNTTVDTRTYTVSTPYILKGFYAPVRMEAVNNVSGGAEVELRFEVFNGTTEVRDPAVVRSVTATPVSCATGASTGPSTDVLGGRALRYDTRKGVFSAEWKVPKRARGCIDVTVTVDGTSLTAHFRVR
ncbi:MAG: carboxypeptidase regulatory-like domain-containing protein [Actinobacteria bacterium]|nr:carboxypeptidase regulatory-like domain-containing protein [Actinomycetota bacterium]